MPTDYPPHDSDEPFCDQCGAPLDADEHLTCDACLEEEGMTP